MVARLLSKESISAHGVEMSNLELPSWLPAVQQRLGNLLYEAVKSASVRLVAPSQRDPGGRWLWEDWRSLLRGCRRTRPRKRLRVRKAPVLLPTLRRLARVGRSRRGWLSVCAT